VIFSNLHHAKLASLELFYHPAALPGWFFDPAVARSEIAQTSAFSTW
jgi:hypothetical protein